MIDNLDKILKDNKANAQPLVDLSIDKYFKAICKFQSAMTFGAEYEDLFHANRDNNKSRVDKLWESLESQLRGVNRNWKADIAAVYFVISSLTELSQDEVSELLCKIKERFRVKEVIWGCITGITTAVYLTIDVNHNNAKPERSTPEELRHLDDMGFGVEKDDDYYRFINGC